MWDTQFHSCQKKGSKNLNENFVIIFHKMLFRSNRKKIWVIRFTFIIIVCLIKHRKWFLLYLPDIFKIPLLFSPTALFWLPTKRGIIALCFSPSPHNCADSTMWYAQFWRIILITTVYGCPDRKIRNFVSVSAKFLKYLSR